MTRKPQKRTQETRTRLLQAARDLGTRDGLDTLTAEAIAREAGVSKGTVFARFGDMDGLLSHLLIDQLERLHEETGRGAAGPDPADDPVGALLEMLMGFVEVITDSETMLRVFLDNIGVTKPSCAAEFVATLDRLDAGLVTYLDAWKAVGWSPKLRRDRTSQEVLDALIAFMIHGAILRKSHQIDDLATLRARLRRHLEAYLLTEPAST